MKLSLSFIPELLPIQTNRVILRKPSLDDVPELFSSYTSDPEVTTFSTWKTHQTVQETQQYIESCLEKWDHAEEYNFCICTLNKPGAPIGMFKIGIVDETLRIGYVLAKSWWGQGIMTEVVKEVTRLLFTNENITTIETTADPDNIASIAVLEKNSFKQVKLLENHVFRPQKSDHKEDSILFVLNKQS